MWTRQSRQRLQLVCRWGLGSGLPRRGGALLLLQQLLTWKGQNAHFQPHSGIRSSGFWVPGDGTVLPQVHAYIISYLKKEMPSVFGKENKKKQLILKLPVIFAKIQLEHHISPGDFPDCQKMQVGGCPQERGLGGAWGSSGEVEGVSFCGLQGGALKTEGMQGRFWKAPPANGSLRARFCELGQGNEDKTPGNLSFNRMEVCFSP